MTRISHPVEVEVEDLMRLRLHERLEKITKDQREFFNRLFPNGVPKDKIMTAIDLCDRTIAKNEKGRGKPC